MLSYDDSALLIIYTLIDVREFSHKERKKVIPREEKGLLRSPSEHARCPEMSQHRILQLLPKNVSYDFCFSPHSVYMT